VWYKRCPPGNVKEDVMYRVRSLLKVNRDGWNGAIENVARLNEIAEQRGWQQASVWTQTFGPFNEIVIEIDYPDLATYERETAAFLADDGAVKLMLDGLQFLRTDEVGYNEMWQRAEVVPAPE
jgi:hypothetical protein